MAKVSLIIPSRTERFLVPTVEDILRNARGDIEVLVVLDGYWEPALPKDKRVVVMHRGRAEGMRPAINWAADAAKGEFLMKLDAHCSVSEGFDVELQKNIDKDWVVVPRRDRLDPIAWGVQPTGKPPIDAHFLSWPYERPNDPACGLHGTVWPQRSRERLHIPIDDEMSSQGSCWFMYREHFLKRIGPLDIASYGNFIQEFQEIGLKTWLGTLGGRVVVNKLVQYLHLHKGRTYGRGYSMAGFNHEAGRDFCTDYWMNDRWSARVRDLRWLIEKFSPVPTWPTDLDRAFRRPGSTVAITRPIGGSMKVEIISAKYGVGAGDGQSVDVTEVLKGLVTDTGLEIKKVGNEVLAVGNPFQGQRKRLTVKYTVDGGPEQIAEALERKSITLPVPPPPAVEASPVPA